MKIISELIDLYLSVKIRKNEEIDNYDSSNLKNERDSLLEDNPSAETLIEYIKISIETLMTIKKEAVAGIVCSKCKAKMPEP